MKIKEGKAKLVRRVESSKGEYPTSISCYRPATHFQIRVRLLEEFNVIRQRLRRLQVYIMSLIYKRINPIQTDLLNISTHWAHKSFGIWCVHVTSSNSQIQN